MRIIVDPSPFDIASELDLLAGSRFDAGAMVSFCGIVRSRNDQPIRYLELEQYPGMTEKALRSFATEAMQRWNLLNCTVIHRYGRLKPGEQIMMVATLSSHRADAFQAAEFLMDYLKSRAPFWKKEVTQSGETWVESVGADERALARW